jgi:hypothetical protein
MAIQIIKEGNWDSPKTKILEQALSLAEQGDHKLPHDLLTMTGMSGTKYRIFINQLVGLTADARYLEIGSWQGSTACSAAHGNKVKVTCIDNWYQGDGIKNAFLTNAKKYMTEGVEFFYEHNNFYDVDYTDIGRYNIYMFDGPHEKEDQYQGLKLAQPALDDVFTLIVDDYNSSLVIDGTQEALRDLNLQVVASVTVKTSNNPYLSRSDWHNGYYIAVIKKDNK